MAELAVIFELEAVDPLNPLVVHVGWRTLDSKIERIYWRRCENSDARFFIQQNPGYSEGHGLLTMVPFSCTHLFISIAHIRTRHTFRKRTAFPR